MNLKAYIFYPSRRNIPAEIRMLENMGALIEAERKIFELRSKAGSEEDRRMLEIELEIIRRLRLEYPYTLKEAFEKLKSRIPDISCIQFISLLEDGKIDFRVIDGKVKVFKRFIDKLAILEPKLAKKMREYSSRSKAREKLYKHVEELISSKISGYIKPAHYRIRMKVTLKENVVKENTKIKCWLPFPLKCNLQPEVKLLSAKPEKYILAPEDYPQRTIFFENVYRGGKLTFEVEYETKCFSFKPYVNPSKVEEGQGEYEEYLRELPPHIEFTSYLENLERKITGGATNPYIRAWRIYKWITENVKYTVAYEYALYENISEYVAKEKKGDCGMQALLFITLCRISRIPSRWQSGWYINPIAYGPHDWAQIYIKPYGWLYVDLSFGGKAYRLGREDIKTFYFGGIDHFRLIFNSDIQVEFKPPKKYFRSDPVDNQRGELEHEGGNLYYDSWSYNLEILEFKET